MCGMERSIDMKENYQNFKIVIEHDSIKTIDDIRRWLEKQLFKKVDKFAGFKAEIIGASVNGCMIIGMLSVNNLYKIDEDIMKGYLTIHDEYIKITAVRKIEY